MADARSNQILAGLSPALFAVIAPHLNPIDLPVRTMLEVRDKRVARIYFIDSGFASVVAVGTSKPSIEVGIIGREGMTGVALLLGCDEPAEHQIYMQYSGAGRWMAASAFRQIIEENPPAQRAMLGFVHAYLQQLAQSVLANGRDKVEERLARWLLMAEDRIGNDMALTHEFLALMLGVRRSGVTTAIQELERKALIEHTRGSIKIVDRPGLEELCNGSYKTPQIGQFVT